jgi:hypothetical protein
MIVIRITEKGGGLGGIANLDGQAIWTPEQRDGPSIVLWWLSDISA